MKTRKVIGAVFVVVTTLTHSTSHPADHSDKTSSTQSFISETENGTVVRGNWPRLSPLAFAFLKNWKDKNEDNTKRMSNLHDADTVLREPSAQDGEDFTSNYSNERMENSSSSFQNKDERSEIVEVQPTASRAILVNVSLNRERFYASPSINMMRVESLENMKSQFRTQMLDATTSCPDCSGDSFFWSWEAVLVVSLVVAWLGLLVVASLLTRSSYGVQLLTKICPPNNRHSQGSDEAEEGHGIGFIDGSPGMRRMVLGSEGGADGKEEEEKEKETVNGNLAEEKIAGAEETEAKEIDEKERQETEETRSNVNLDNKEAAIAEKELVLAVCSTSKEATPIFDPKWLNQRSKSLPTETLTEMENLPRKLSLIQEEILH